MKLFKILQTNIPILLIKKLLKIKRQHPEMPVIGGEVDLPWFGLQEHDCFGCAPHKVNGLKLRFYQTNQGGLATKWSSTTDFQNYPGMIHGGIGFTILDELIGQTVFHEAKHLAVSITADVKWLRPIRSGDQLVAWAKVKISWKNMYAAEAFLYDSNGKVLMTVRATCYTPNKMQFLRMMGLQSVSEKIENWFVK